MPYGVECKGQGNKFIVLPNVYTAKYVNVINFTSIIRKLNQKLHKL